MAEKNKSEEIEKEISQTSKRFEEAVESFRKANQEKEGGNLGEGDVDLVLLKAKRMVFTNLQRKYGLSNQDIENLGSPSEETVEEEWRDRFSFENPGLEGLMDEVALSLNFVALGKPDIPIWEKRDWKRI